jgi:spoIIIJ-associated protein
VVVDAAGYRERRRETLESLAMRSAQRAISSGEPVELEPMSSIERRIVHLRLQDEPGVSTRSEGDEPYRYVVIEVG